MMPPAMAGVAKHFSPSATRHSFSNLSAGFRQSGHRYRDNRSQSEIVNLAALPLAGHDEAGPMFAVVLEERGRRNGYRFKGDVHLGGPGPRAER